MQPLWKALDVCRPFLSGADQGGVYLRFFKNLFKYVVRKKV
jgi:hypothetical protein